jgi:hypothetical protein
MPGWGELRTAAIEDGRRDVADWLDDREKRMREQHERHLSMTFTMKAENGALLTFEPGHWYDVEVRPHRSKRDGTPSDTRMLHGVEMIWVEKWGHLEPAFAYKPVSNRFARKTIDLRYPGWVLVGMKEVSK